MKPIPYGRQYINEDDLEAVKEALLSDYLTQGPLIEKFEKEFAAYCQADYCTVVSNGTAALHLAALALDIKPGDKVITTPITFAASANGFRYCGAEIIFCDIDPQTYLLDLNKLEDILKNDTDNKCKCVVPVDFAGYPVYADKLRVLADKYGICIVEDACHSPGGYFVNKNGEKQLCGNGKFSDMTVFSFHPVKHIATGEGGAITTNNPELDRKVKLYRTHGITKDPDIMEKNDGGWYYEMVELGYNYRLTDIQAALGISQLKRAGENLAKRGKIAERYNQAFAGIDNLTTPFTAPDIFHAYHLYVIQVDNRKGLYDYLRQNNIYAQVHYIPVHLMPFYRKEGWKKGDFPVAEAYYERCLSLPMYPTLTEEEQEYVIEKVKSFIGK